MRPASGAMIVCFAACLAACQSGNRPAPSGAGMDMFTPVKMRLHPLSRLAPASATAPATAPAPQVEARVELTDQFGDTGKGVGVLTFELFAYDALSITHRGTRLATWSRPLTSPDENRTYWDPITRTYFFKLPVDPGALGDHNRLLLEATLTLPNGERFDDSLTLRVK